MESLRTELEMESLRAEIEHDDQPRTAIKRVNTDG